LVLLSEIGVVLTGGEKREVGRAGGTVRPQLQNLGHGLNRFKNGTSWTTSSFHLAERGGAREKAEEKIQAKEKLIDRGSVMVQREGKS